MAERLPELITGPGGIVLRRWARDDADALAEAVTQSMEHLRPWMPWVEQEPLSIVQRRARIDEWERGWHDGGDVVMGVFADGRVAGGCGLHHRIGPDALEIGYWTHVSFLRLGIATTASTLLAAAAFTRSGLTHVEIHHDKANVASGAIPRRLGFQLVREAPDGPEAPGGARIACEWRLTRERWNEGRLWT